jgi:hypothetical protein
MGLRGKTWFEVFHVSKSRHGRPNLIEEFD